jgi:hypothetical protein
MYIHMTLINKVAVDMCSFLQLTDDTIIKSIRDSGWYYSNPFEQFSNLSERILTILLCQAFTNVRRYLYSIEDRHNIFNIDDFHQFIENKQQTDKVMNDLTQQKNDLENMILSRKAKLQSPHMNIDPLTRFTIELSSKVITSHPSVDESVSSTLQSLLEHLMIISKKHCQDQDPLIKQQHPKIIIISTNIYRLVNRDKLFPLETVQQIFNWPAFNNNKYNHLECKADFEKAVNKYAK